jgi:hypothetical protein
MKISLLTLVLTFGLSRYASAQQCVTPNMPCSSSTDICCSTGDFCGAVMVCPAASEKTNPSAVECLMDGFICMKSSCICCVSFATVSLGEKCDPN